MVNTYEDIQKLNIAHPFVFGFAAPHNSGKTFLIKRLLMEIYNNSFDYIVIVSPTLEFKDEYDDVEHVLNNSTTLLKIDSDLPTKLSAVLREQQHVTKLHTDHPDEYDEVKTLIVLDDCVDTDLLRFNAVDNKVDLMAMRGRHFNVSVIYAVQSLSAISLNTRKNTDALFVFSPQNFKEIDRVLEEYVPKAFRKQFMEQILDLWKIPYAFLLVDSTGDRRGDFRLRLRNGFRDLLFAKTGDEEMETKKIVKKRKRKQISQDDSAE